MSLDKATVARISRLARIATTDEEQERLAGELSGILDWVEQLGEVDTDNVEPMTSVVEMLMASREDAVTDGGVAGDIVKNAPKSDHGFFVVPKVVE
ncbi:MAG: Asp-tRNA(Asn)/Glu-tRNA(Gln) amidotransferase subunit GatC [Alphaproteobacteria bacterium]|jgi:aspartyl-tRNA(Asn)/glutamyl-tRNA(Gln) amidotransferase subunit C|nr:Asp-tRNA(Asn)/Glu-tRNA(Gln) amidotransferase subunit GatC [Rhodospirillaceae bacterium]MDG2479994.1 Asp-tRNA(Asn)/Glu-tRNA(Gln) amidotransferase subunit GatC [Alphaproteobacteria bacterium]MBT6203888.1 Asp-tRNA(Asn)/Glu-tRNA(Gln) amidotransferase subunit GatC [Rhodospirillaceae bacterium]MBT6511037.1 Asp-tRNA(Asn)/Glu-tRNA(Gln) amidotransferase subunit GatC [Rhodospirillaceae bacterium]MBT7612177.1 Asp-tRNA(Asn)/Glu-tRNA(Gln) amidotransferase subunit GatC [Rhodospirillaceae bacterium]